MNPLVENQTITELDSGENFSYVLSNNRDFLLTEYKVLQNQRTDVFVDCMKMQFNGKTQLFYLSGKYKPLSALLTSIEPSNFMRVMANIFSNVLSVQNNGFLSCQNLDISLTKIFVDPSNLQVRMVYLPVATQAYDSNLSFESALRSTLNKVIQNELVQKNDRVEQFALELTDGTLTLSDLYNKIKGLKTQPTAATSQANNSTDKISLKLMALNSPSPFQVHVNKTDFVIGRSDNVCDGAIPYNKAIGRKHCLITRVDQTYYITDLESANGTFVNNRRLVPNQKHELNHLDIIRLANSDFQVNID